MTARIDPPCDVAQPADHERAAAAYRIAGLIDDTRNAMKETV